MLTEAGHEPSALEGAKSQYDVVANGTSSSRSSSEGRFPEEDEVVALLRGGAS